MRKKDWDIGLCIAVSIIIFFIFLGLSFPPGPLKTLRLLFHRLIQDYYHPHYNSFSLPSIFGVSVNHVVYAFLFILIILLGLLKLLRTTPRESSDKRFTTQVLAVTSVVFLTVLLFQTIGQVRYFSKIFSNFHNRNLDQKLDIICNVDSYQFVKFCLAQLSGKSRGTLMTDSDFNKSIDPYLIMYYLYPAIDLRGEKGLKRYLVIFNKDHPLSAVPDNYRIVGMYNSKGLLAVQKDD